MTMPRYRTVASRHVVGRYEPGDRTVNAWRIEVVQVSGDDANVPFFAKVEQGWYAFEEADHPKDGKPTPRDLLGDPPEAWDAEPGVVWNRKQRVTFPAQSRPEPSVVERLGRQLMDLSSALEGSDVEEAVLDARREGDDDASNV